MLRYCFLLLFAILIIQCTPTKPMQGQCSTLGTFKDLSGLDGCGLVIELENGDRLIPIEYPANSITFEGGQQVKFGYQPLDRMTICMAGQPVKITCIQPIE